ncbi:hypothetical protein HFD88_003737 [Aspergillus terreus]|nr:hypothetical protein HFD88_003737 [Aspergillus terreus]
MARASTDSSKSAFTSEAPGEVIIIWLRYLVDILIYDVEDRYWNETMMQEATTHKEVADDQVSYYPKLRATIGGEDDTFYISQWVATLSALPEYGIELTSIFMLNPVLYWYGMMEMGPTGFPTVMLMDYASVRLQGE